MRILNHSTLEQALSTERCIEAMSVAMTAASAGLTDVPLRSHLPIRGTQGKLVVMPGAMSSQNIFGLKIVSKYPRPPGSLVGTHVGMVIVFDTADGLPLALLEGGTLTEIRTAAASALATRTLAREDASVLAVIGTGAQAFRHALAVPKVRPIQLVRIWGRTQANAQRLATSLSEHLDVPVEVSVSAEAAVRDAQVICTTTSSPEPVLRGEWLSPGAHVNLVGAAVPSSAEADTVCLQRARIYVDLRSAAAAEAGELRAALAAGEIGEDAIVGEIGEVLLGRVPGRTTADQITLYKSLGMAAQDLAAARAALDSAKALGLGFDIDLAE